MQTLDTLLTITPSLLASRRALTCAMGWDPEGWTPGWVINTTNHGHPTPFAEAALQEMTADGAIGLLSLTIREPLTLEELQQCLNAMFETQAPETSATPATGTYHWGAPDALRWHIVVRQGLVQCVTVTTAAHADQHQDADATSNPMTAVLGG